MIDPAEVSSKQAQALRTARLMWIVFLITACGFVLMAHRVQNPHPQLPPPASFNTAFVAIAAADLVLFAFLRRNFLGRARKQAAGGETDIARATWLTAQMLGFASAMSVILFGFVLHFMGTRPPWLSTGFFIAGFAAFIIFRPQSTQE